jgi:hypothetical protein
MVVSEGRVPTVVSPVGEAEPSASTCLSRHQGYDCQIALSRSSRKRLILRRVTVGFIVADDKGEPEAACGWL